MIPIDFETHDLRNLGFLIRFISSSGEIGTATISSRFNGQIGAKQGRSYQVRRILGQYLRLFWWSVGGSFEV